VYVLVEVWKRGGWFVCPGLRHGEESRCASLSELECTGRGDGWVGVCGVFYLSKWG
jgi:hypothetical protein